MVLRIRITSLPPSGEFDEFDLRPYRVGGTYELPMRLASLLVLGGYAESAGSAMHAEAADFGQPRFPSARFPSARFPFARIPSPRNKR
jgi:hypothetical protein